MSHDARDGLRTGEVARLFDVAEYRLANLIRFRQIDAPPVLNGRRLWRPQDVAAARRVLVARGVIGAELPAPESVVGTPSPAKTLS